MLNLLMKVSNRLAVDGEELIVHRFQDGRVGLASAFDVRVNQELRKVRCHGFWPRVKELIFPVTSEIVAVLVPPGARLMIRDISVSRQFEWRVFGETQTAVFTILTDEGNTFQDAVRFANGIIALLSRLVEGQRVRVLSVSAEEESAVVPGFGITIRMGSR